MIVNENYYENLIKTSTIIYCRQVTMIKDFDLNYDHDFDFEDDFRNFIKLIQTYFVKIRVSIDEKSFNIKETLSDFYVKKHKAVLNVEMIVHKKMKTYERVRLSNLFSETKIFTSRIVFRVKRNLKNEIFKFKAR